MTARISQQLKASQYSKVFSLVLKTVTDVQVRMSAGSEFHWCGAANFSFSRDCMINAH